ncbi:class II aaRS and biotin synthetase [Athelia psychrophila]|uniref:Class II aaRS and biotin synthetase n=1 Tax=Athelia psychrophila TaxID=1759441 RepID=A0A166J3D7_9AGAM|nr:class II aaRS and biotin synthetase [Fibularhizoctonia sp. CBS 109695]
MNVLVYAGPEVLQASLKHTLSTLRSILVPHYTVQSISRESLVSHPWSTSCALLVFPGCYALTPSPSIALIKGFVENGGAFLALSSGAAYTCASQGVGISSFSGIGTGISRDQALRFRDTSSNESLKPTFNLGPKAATSSVSLRLASGQELAEVQYNGSSFEGFEGATNSKTLAWIGDKIAAVRCDMSKGKVALWAPSVELPVPGEPNVATDRQTALRDTLTSLGLNLSSGTPISAPLPQYLSVSPDRQDIITQILKPYFDGSLKVLKERHDVDTLQFHDADSDEAKQVLIEARARSTSAAPSDPSEWQPKHIFVSRDGTLPAETTYFDISLYYSALSAARKLNGLSSSDDNSRWGMGEALLYTEAVTSTQIMFDSNPGFMSALGTPLLSLASHQLSGRGRGSNIWLSPSGCLQFSLLLRVPSMGAKLVFVQYLFGLAVAEACRDAGVLGDLGSHVRLKWPNDLYAIVGQGPSGMKKIGGILVNTRSCGNETEIIIGCGLNVLTESPIFSLAQLVPESSSTNLSMERTAAIIMATFETMWDKFCTPNGVSFEPLMDLYLERWLHSYVPFPL